MINGTHELTPLHALWLFGAALMAGALNGVVGGGSFISFPALLFTGVPPINANATSNTAIWIGMLASVGAYRRDLTNQYRHLVPLVLVSVVGSVAGSLLLLHTSQATFTRLIPYLLLLATVLFTLSEPFKQRLQNHQVSASTASHVFRLGVLLLQLAIATYGGFFGGGMGILMLATLSLMGIGTIHTQNAVRAVLSTSINITASIPFLLAGVIVWQQAALMAIGAILGGYWSAFYARQLPPKLVRRFVILVGFIMTLYFFWRSGE
ncbi:sulfite exporter TauE/SafE family protein [Kovacikia minuta CCNUW1]|uniref:sulfite exporter TauE/SafE family protein n=1 Tax=Kovacikia minuta TaxID=2931930 RepID=UPI001CCFBD46|nr:sulfite exporter TauE/SafE family protein [Kovacikia minuta]UBF27816.1 sulfite exporter TauE/SafE family protein [Kovacikia minuta CCNUW1]